MKENKIIEKNSFVSIQVLRFFAAISVMMYHYSFMFYERAYIEKTIPSMWSFFQYGYLGVDLFFIISGFVIAMSAEGRSFMDFSVSRFARLFPVFWACIIVTSFYLFLYGSVTNDSITFNRFFSNLTMLPGFFGSSYVDGSAWSLAIELRFYFLVALVLLFGLYKQLDSIAFFVSSLLLVDIISMNFFPSLFNTSIGGLFSHNGNNWAGYFCAGILFYSLYKKGWSYKAFFGILFSLGVTLYYAIKRAPDLSFVYHTFFNPTVIVFYIVTFYLLFFAIIYKFFKKLPYSQNKKMQDFLLYCGVLTYPLYLLHQTIGRGFFVILEKNNFSIYVSYAITISSILILSVLINKYVDIRGRIFIMDSYKKIKFLLYKVKK